MKFLKIMEMRSLCICISFAIGFLLGMFNCSHVEFKTTDYMQNDSLKIFKEANKQLTDKNILLDQKCDKLQAKNDSLEVIRNKAISRWEKSIPDAIIVVDSANCDSLSKRQIKAAIDTMRMATQSIIATDSMDINLLNLIIEAKDEQLNNDSVIISNNIREKAIRDEELKQSKKALRRQKIKTKIIATAAIIATSITTYFAISR